MAVVPERVPSLASIDDLVGSNHTFEGQLLEAMRAVRRGDFSVRLPTNEPGIAGQVAEAFNDIVELNHGIELELRRIRRVVGQAGRIRERASVESLQGDWARQIRSVNQLIDDITAPASEVTRVLDAVARGDLGQKLSLEHEGRSLRGDFRKSGETVNTMVDQLNAFASEVTRVAREVGTEGKLGGQADVKGVAGTWKDLTDSVNSMAANLTTQVRNIAEVTTAVAQGDLSRKITVDVRGEILELKTTVNTMVDQLNAFASEVTRVAREVGTEGRLGGQAEVKGVAGTWKDLTDSVNFMAGNLTAQVRNIAEVVTAVANGDLSQKLAVKADGEIAALAGTINSMTDTLAIFADQVTTVAREVGIEGKLGGQADVPGAAGTWRDLTDNVNQLAANLTTQVRAIGEVATAVTRGDLSRTIQVQAEGEVELLKDDVNEMIRKLRDTTRENEEQDWLKTNLARFARLLQGQRDLRTVGRLVLSELAPLVGIQHGVFYLVDRRNEALRVRALATFAAPEHLDEKRVSEGLVGQVARDGRRMIINEVPGDYIAISSGLGNAAPHSIVIQPVTTEGEAQAVLEIASFSDFSPVQLSLLDQLGESIGIVLNSINASLRSEQLLQAQAARAEAEAGLARLRQVVDVMPEGILIADASGGIYLRNAAAEEIMGVVAAHVIPQEGETAPAVRRLDGVLCEPEHTPLARAVFGGEVVKGEQLVVTNPISQLDVPILVNSAPLSDGLGHAAGGVSVFQDITPLRDLERQKDEFLAAVSHDLKTPATIIMGRASLLKRALTRSEPPDGPDFAEGLQSIEESTNQLVRLINEMLDVTRLRMGQTVELDLGPADLVKIAGRLSNEYQNMSPRHTIVLDTELTRLLGDWDEARIERVVSNLLSNSVKYSPQGGDIRVGAEREEREGGDWAVLTVKDWGLGIPESEVARVFEPYYRGTNVAATTSGTGVGLAGTRHIVEQHGGVIEVESAPNDATTFTVRLPLIRDEDEFDS